MANYMNYSYAQLKKFCDDAFEKFGFNKEEAGIITDVLLLADLYGIDSHGTQRLVRYHKDIAKGLIKVEAEPEVVFETPVSAVIDAHDGMGQVVGHKAMKMAIEKAKKSGIAIVSVRNSTHYGIAGYYSKMACDEGLIGISTTNTTAIMVPTFGRQAMLGSNPIAIAFPAEPTPFFFDASTTVVTRGKLEVYNKLDKPLHDGWAIDSTGNESTDAARVLGCIINKEGGGILPLGGSVEDSGSHTGYGWGMVAELFSSIISMGTTSDKTNVGGKGGICHGFMVIDPKIFGDAEGMKAHLSAYLEELRNSPKAEGQDRIYTHGEKEVEAMAERMKTGININVNTVAEMRDLAQFLGMDVAEYLGEEALTIKGKESLYK
ncbi:MAG: Ldh family oxidoreductase [Clostridia bacterium]|nr:Ldh family oxidoreductase [Clostridia bacterium]